MKRLARMLRCNAGISMSHTSACSYSQQSGSQTGFKSYFGFDLRSYLKLTCGTDAKHLGLLDFESQVEASDGVKGLRKFLNKQNKKFCVSVEGNIGCGKSTLLDYFQSCPTVETLKEPVEQWTNVQGYNALNLLYEDPKRWCFTFNNYATLTRLQMHKHVPNSPVKMLERSLYSTQYIFAEQSKRKGDLSSIEHAVLTEWFERLLATEHLPLDLIVYLRADPDVCYERLKKRNRKEESTVPLKFLEELHELHEQWLIAQDSHPLPAPVLILDASHQMDEMKQLYEIHKSDILGGLV